MMQKMECTEEEKVKMKRRAADSGAEDCSHSGTVPKAASELRVSLYLPLDYSERLQRWRLCLAVPQGKTGVPESMEALDVASRLLQGSATW